MPDKQIVFRAMEPTRGQAALLAALVPTPCLSYQLLDFSIYFPLARANFYSLGRRRGNKGGDKAMGSFSLQTIEKA